MDKNIIILISVVVLIGVVLVLNNMGVFGKKNTEGFCYGRGCRRRWWRYRYPYNYPYYYYYNPYYWWW